MSLSWIWMKQQPSVEPSWDTTARIKRHWGDFTFVIYVQFSDPLNLFHFIASKGYVRPLICILTLCFKGSPLISLFLLTIEEQLGLLLPLWRRGSGWRWWGWVYLVWLWLGIHPHPWKFPQRSESYKRVG